MTKVLKMLGVSGLAAVLGAVLMASVALAESPPNPPSRFAGSVMVNGANAASGTSVEARIGETTCGTTTVFTANGEARYKLDVPALDPGATPNCGTDGATVAFYVGGTKANETGTWHNYDLGLVDLTVTTATATPVTPTASPSAAPSVTPKAPVTGSGTTPSSEGTAVWLFALLGFGAIAFGVGGVTVARKTNR